MRIERRVRAAVASGAAVTLAVATLPWARFAYQGAEAHLILETAEGVIGLGVAYLVLGRVRASGRRRDVALLAALALSAAANLLLGAGLELFADSRTDVVGVWGSLVVRTIASALIAAAPFLRGAVRTRPGTGRPLVLGALALTVLAGVTVWLSAGRLPEAFAPGLSPLDSRRPLLTGHPTVLALQMFMACAYGVSAVGWARLARRHRDDFLSWVAAGVALGAFARLNYLLFPSLYTDWVYTGDLLRLGFWLLLLVGAGREVRAYWEHLADAAVAEERRRIARDLHDGMAQELAYLVGQTARLGDAYEVELRGLRGAAERALFESRRAIALLSGRGDEPLPALLVRAAEEVGHRYETRVRLTGEFAASVEEREALVRIVREAVTNAARHGKARTVTLELTDDDAGRRLCVRDDGLGFQPAPDRETGFGIVGMRERVEALAGTLRIDAAPGKGVTVEVTLP